MRRLALIVAAACFVAAFAYNVRLTGASPQAAAQASQPGQPPQTPRAVLDRYCVACHNSRVKTAGLALDKVDLAQTAEHA